MHLCPLSEQCFGRKAAYSLERISRKGIVKATTERRSVSTGSDEMMLKTA